MMPLDCMKIQQTIVEVNLYFEGMDGLGLSAIDCVLQHNRCVYEASTQSTFSVQFRKGQ